MIVKKTFRGQQVRVLAAPFKDRCENSSLQKKFQKTKVATANDDHRLEEMRRSCAQHHAEKTRKQKTRKLLVSCSRRLAVDFDLAARLPN
jgi:hypothetical protein